MRKRLLVVLALSARLVLAAGLAFAADENKAAPEGPLTVPEGAVKVDNLTWRHTDGEGKSWTYRRTPFGLVRFETPDEEEAKAASSQSGSPALKAFDEGDQVRFERQGPFGIYRWARKKTELTDEEREAWERAQSEKPKTPAGTASKESDKP